MGQEERNLAIMQIAANLTQAKCTLLTATPKHVLPQDIDSLVKSIFDEYMDMISSRLEGASLDGMPE